MLNGRRKAFGGFAGSILVAASSLVAAPAPAQTGGGVDYYNCYDPTGGNGGYGYGYGCCQYDEAWGGWYRMYATHMEPCTGPYGQAPEEPADRPSQELPESPEQ